LPESVLDLLKRSVDAESASDSVLPLEPDFYGRVAAYAQNLHRQAGAGTSEVTVMLVKKQSELLEVMVRGLVSLRLQKAFHGRGDSNLTAEERDARHSRDEFEMGVRGLVEAVSGGRPSFLELARRREDGRMAVVRILKPVSEIVGLDLRKYGPYNVNDIASLPEANATLLIANGDAAQVVLREPD
jgi:DNA replication factor GINS